LDVAKEIGTNNELLKKVRAVASTLIGIEPDTTVTPAPGIFDNFENSLFEDSAITDQSIDVAYSVMVM